MNILFLTLVSFNTIQEHGIYTDLLREFVKNDHEVYVVSPTEKREGQETHIIKEDHAAILRLQIGDTQKTSTMPITLVGAIEYVKNRDGTKT